MADNTAEQTDNLLDAEGRRRRKDRPVVEKKRHPLETVPFFDRPLGASIRDLQVGEDDVGNPVFKTTLGDTYTVRLNPDQRNLRQKFQDDVFPAIEAYLKDPTLPTKEQVVGAGKAVAEAVKETVSIPKDLLTGEKSAVDVTMVDVFDTAGMMAVGSAPFKVPEGSLRILGGPGAKDYSNRSLYKARELKAEGYSPKEIEEITGRVQTGRTEDYIPNELEKNPQVPFKFEIPDKGIIIKKNDGYITLREANKQRPMRVGNMIPTHTKLFEQYPSLKNTAFYIDPKLGRGAHFDRLDGTYGSIVIGADHPGLNKIISEGDVNNPKFREVFFHELQHAAQAKDFHQTALKQLGGGSETYSKAVSGRDPFGKDFTKAAINNNPKLSELRDKMVKLYEKNKGNFSNPKTAKEMAELTKELDYESYKTYLQTASEVEAAVVGARAKPTFGKDQPSVSSEVSKRKDVETYDEYARGYSDSKIKKLLKRMTTRKADLTKEEVRNLSTKGENFARYALGIDKELGVNANEFPTQVANQPNIISFTEKKEAKELQDTFNTLNTKMQDSAKKLGKIVQKAKTEGIFGEYEIGATVKGRNKNGPLPFKIEGHTLDEVKLESDRFKRLQDRVDGGLTIIEKDGKYYIPKLITSNEKGQKGSSYLDLVKSNNYPIMGKLEAVDTLKAENFDPKIDFRKPKEFAEGGVAMKDQMEMAFMQEGGLRDDGMDVDPVSGNDVPPGSMASEVRDDIPAQLSEGEYVVPADVVQYYGVKFFEDLRMDAKRGLADMESNGRIGGEPVDMPMDMPMDDTPTVAVSTGGYIDGMPAAEYNVGGMTGSLYNNPTQMDQEVNNIISTMYNNPQVMDELSRRGIQLNRTQAQMMPQQMDQANPPAEARMGFNPGGLTDNQAAGYNYVTSPTTINPMYQTPGASYTFASPPQLTTTGVDSSIPSVENCAKMGMDYDPVGKVCIPKATTQTPQQGGGSDDDGDPFANMPKPDPDAWMEGYDYTGDLSTLAEQTGEALSSESFLPGPLGTFEKGTKMAHSAAHIILLQAQGEDGKAEELIKQWEKARTGGLKLTPFEFINGDRFAIQAAGEHGILLDRGMKHWKDDKPIFKDDRDYEKYRVKYDAAVKAKQEKVAKTQDTEKPGDDRFLGGTKTGTTDSGTPIYKPGPTTTRPKPRPKPKPEPSKPVFNNPEPSKPTYDDDKAGDYDDDSTGINKGGLMKKKKK